jgi:hypothetical protein
LIDAYVAELSGVLSGPRRAKRDLLTEARDSLVDSTEAYERRGLNRRAAERRAVADFGGVQEVAPAYQTELGLAQGRRTALLVIIVLAPQHLIWDNAPTTGLGLWYSLLHASMAWIGGVAIGGSVLATIATGFGLRFLGPDRPVARATGVFALFAAGFFAICSIVLAVFADTARLLLGLNGLPLAVLFVVVPMVGVAISARRTLAAA